MNTIHKKYSLLILFTGFILFSACHRPKYFFTVDSDPHTLGYTEGKWLMNEIDAPLTVKPEIEAMAVAEFSEELGSNFQQVHKAANVIIPGAIPIKPSKEILQNLKIGTPGYDYFINIKAEVIKNEVGGMQVGKVREEIRNEVGVHLEVYDLKTGATIYNQHIIGVLSIENDNHDFALAKGSNKMLLGGFKRIMKKID